MIEPTLLTALATIALASAPPNLAVADLGGHIHVTTDRGAHWQTVHTCADAPRPELVVESTAGAPAQCMSRERRAAVMTWSENQLYGACADGVLWQWQPTATRAHNVAGMGHLDVRALTSQGSDLVLGDRAGTLWTLSDNGQSNRLMSAPEPIRALHASQSRLLLAGRSAIWEKHLESDGWRLLVATRACALVADEHPETEPALFAAGPDGVLHIAGETIEVRSISPGTSLALWRDQLLVAHDARVRGMATRDAAMPAPNASPPPIVGASGSELTPPSTPKMARARRLSLRRRYRIAQMLPELSAVASMRRLEQSLDLRFTIWLRWRSRREAWERVVQ